MASKYEGLKGRIPEQEKAPSPRDQAVTAELKEYGGKTLDELTSAYNRLQGQIDDANTALAVLKNRESALEILILKGIEGANADKMGFHDYTWSVKYEPYPVADNPAATIQYFKDNGMEDQLKLSASEVASRLKKHVKEEALANELEITIEMVDGPDGPVERKEVRSKVPGVKVFLAKTMSRVKSTASKRS